MTKSARFSHTAPVFNGINVPEEGFIVGYSAIIQELALKIPIPSTVALVCKQNKKYQTDKWIVFPKSYLPNDNLTLPEIEALYNHLVFALKYEGVNLLLFSALVKFYSVEQLTQLVSFEPTGQYSRKIWFLVEWISGEKLSQKPDLQKKSYIPLLDHKLQYSIEGIKSPRHMVINNLPGTQNFCPLIRKTPKLETYISANLSEVKNEYLKKVHKDILQRASAFLLLKDSKASFTIEGESPKSKRAARWGQAIGQAGMHNLSKTEILRLQQLVIENPRFLEMGYRQKGGFVGEHDRVTGEPLPDHISAKWQDLETLMNGLLETDKLLLNSNIDAVICASVIAFGFVFIHPLEDGNGRIHRYLIHHILSKKKFSKQGIIFPVSAAILDKIDDYRKVLENYSLPLLGFIEWKETNDHNVEVLNDTIDFYRYFDATELAEFLFDCVNLTIEDIIPKEVEHLTQYDSFKKIVEEEYEIPDHTIALLVRFLEQGNGILSKRAREKEFEKLTDAEIKNIEKYYAKIFH